MFVIQLLFREVGRDGCAVHVTRLIPALVVYPVDGDLARPVELEPGSRQRTHALGLQEDVDPVLGREQEPAKTVVSPALHARDGVAPHGVDLVEAWTDPALVLEIRLERHARLVLAHVFGDNLQRTFQPAVAQELGTHAARGPQP